MRRAGPAFVAILALALCAGCARHHDARVSGDLKDAGRSAREAAARIGHDPDVKNAEADLRQAGHDAGKDLRKAAAEAREAAHRLSGDAHRAAHDVTRPQKDDDNS